MIVAGSLFLFKLVLMSGLALWMTLVAINNVIAFRSGVAAIGAMMNMQLFDQEPKIASPLLARRTASAAWHRLIYTLVLLMEIAVATLLTYAVLGFAGTLFGQSDIMDAIIRANLALSALAAMNFVLMLGGVWFAYYIRQEGLQIIHFAMMAVTIAATIVINMPA